MQIRGCNLRLFTIIIVIFFQLAMLGFSSIFPRIMLLQSIYSYNFRTATSFHKKHVVSLYISPPISARKEVKEL